MTKLTALLLQLVGVLLVTAGLWLVDPRAAMVVLGVVLTVVGEVRA